MIAQRPYLLRALYEWIVDSDEIPYVLVDATVEGVAVPEEHVVDGQIVLNISANAVRNLAMENDFVMCTSRFDGRAFELCLPIMSIKAIYCKDSGEGMVFPEETATDAARAGQADSGKADNSAVPPEPPSGDEAEKKPDDKPTLRLV